MFQDLVRMYTKAAVTRPAAAAASTVQLLVRATVLAAVGVSMRSRLIELKENLSMERG